MEIGDSNLVIRVIKPFTEFYNQLISIVLRYGIRNFQSVSSSDFIDAVENSFKNLWRPSLTRPTMAFYDWCKKEGNLEVGELFENLKYDMLQLWETEIINTANHFKRMKNN